MKNDNYTLFLKAKELIKKRKNKEAEIILRKLNSLEPYDNVIKFELAKLLLKNKETIKEGKDLLISLLNTSNKTYAILELGRLEVSIGNYTKARNYFEELINNSKSSPRDKVYAMLELGRLEVAIGNYTKARNYFEELLNTSSKTYAMLELGRLEVVMGNYTKARNYFEELINNSKSSPRDKVYAMLELGRLEVTTGNYTKARNYFEELINNSKSSPQDKAYAMLELGRLEALMGNYSEARNYFEELLNTSSKQYAMLELGRLEVVMGNYTKARNYFEELINNSKRSLHDKTYAMLELIYLEIKGSNYTKAYHLLDELIKCNDIDINMIKQLDFYLKYKLGLLTKEEKESNKYFCKQLLNYNEKDTIEHIKNNLDENGNKRIHSLYNENIDVNKLYDDIKIKIKNMNPNIFTIVDKYIVEYDYLIGNTNGIDTNKIEVITYLNTKNIITMYPVINGYVSDEITKYKEKSKVKRIESQIDKFNRKYGLE